MPVRAGILFVQAVFVAILDEALGGVDHEDNCYDNAAMETFFKTIKAELIWRHSWQTRPAAELAIFEYINGFYNPRRRHPALGWKSPFSWFVSQTTVRQRLDFERKAA